MDETLNQIQIKLKSLFENDAVQTQKLFQLQTEVHKLMLEYDAKLRGYQSQNEFSLIQNKLGANTMLSVLSYLTLKELIKVCLVSKRFQILVSKILVQKIQQQHIGNGQLMVEIQGLEQQIVNYQPSQDEQARHEQISGELFQITKNGINEIKSYNNPPKIVMDVLNILNNVIIGKNKKQSWKQFIGDQQFLHSLLNFDIENISDEQIIQLRLSMEIPQEKAQVISHTTGILLRFLQSLYQLTQQGVINIKLQSKNKKKKLLRSQHQVERLEKFMNIIIS